MGKTKAGSLKFKNVSRWIRILFRVIGVLIVILILALVYLRSYGIPDPLLRAVIRRANEAGIPVDISSIKPGLHGWQADDVRYYSLNPADTKPIFKADEVHFPRFPLLRLMKAEGWEFDIEALGVEIGPSVEWGVEVPEHSQIRNIETIKLTLSFLPDRIELSDGTMHWLGSRFSVNGTIVKATGKTSAKPDAPGKVKQKTVSPVYVSKEMFQSLEDRFNAIQVEGEATIDIAFHVDANDYSTSTLKIEATADEIMVREVGFSRAAISANYRYPLVQLEHMALHREGKAAQLTGTYDLSTKLLQGNLSNTITSKQLLRALPRRAHVLMEKLGMDFGQLPLFEVSIAPCNPAEALNHVSGTFSVEDFNYAGSTIQSLGGKVERQNDRLLLSGLEGTMLGLENRAEETGSAMLGGTASGSVYFDSQTYYYGVNIDMNLDPSLLIGPLSIVRIATNVMHRFKFNGDKPPSGHVELGQCVTNLSTFFIDIQMTGDEVTLHDAEFSSVDLSASYSNKVLVLEPLTAMLGTNDLTGMVSIDFRQSIAGFDISTSMPPQTLQDAVTPSLDVFGKSIKTSGTVGIKAEGRIDWKQMKATAFNAEIYAQQIELPVARLTNFTGTVFGEGPLLTVKDTQFTLYEGKGAGDISIDLDPEKQGLPLGIDLNFEQVNLKQCLLFFKPDAEVKTFGELGATVLLQTDLKEDFLESANGDVSVAIKNGQLADLPFLNGFSDALRKVLPSFNIFTFTGFSGDFELGEGMVKSDNAYLEGELISAKANGLYSQTDGFDVKIQVQTFGSGTASKAVRIITDPIFKLLEFKLEGSMSEPSWKFE